MVRRTSWASAAAGAESARRGGVTGREGDRGPGGGIAQEGRNGRRGGPGRQDGAQGSGRQGDAPSSQADPELLAGASQAAAERPRRAAEAPCSLVEREALEVAEHHRQAEGPRQAVDLAVDGLGLLAVDRRLVGRRGHRLGQFARARTGTTHRATLLSPPPAGDLLPCTPRRPDRDPVQPVAQQVRVTDRPGLASQDHEHGLEGVLRMLQVAQELPADAQDHRPVPAHQGGERGLAGRLTPPGGEPLQELPVSKPGHRAALEERLELPDH